YYPLPSASRPCPPPPRLFPYTTLFRSILASLPPGAWHTGWVRDAQYAIAALSRSGHGDRAKAALDFLLNADAGRYPSATARRSRSEEHTSELQSHLNLVCRLLLEKKKK